MAYPLKYWDGSSWNTVAQAAVDYSFVPQPNILNNGSMIVNQRGGPWTSTSYTVDRWIGSVAGTTTFSQDTSDAPIGFSSALKWTTGASSSYGQFKQYLEQLNVKPLRGQTLAYSFYAKVSAGYTGTINPAFYYSNSSDASASVTTAVSTVTPTSFTPTTSWARYSGTVTVPIDAVGFAFHIIPSVAQASGVTVSITGVKLEIGTIPTAFQHKSFADELAECQRYYYRATAASSAYAHFSLGFASSTTSSQQDLQLPVTMRVEPTAVEFASLRLEDVWSAQAVTSLTLSTNSSHPNVATLDVYVASGLTAYRPYFLGANNSTSAYVGVSADL